MAFAFLLTVSQQTPKAPRLGRSLRAGYGNVPRSPQSHKSTLCPRSRERPPLRLHWDACFSSPPDSGLWAQLRNDRTLHSILQIGTSSSASSSAPRCYILWNQTSSPKTCQDSGGGGGAGLRGTWVSRACPLSAAIPLSCPRERPAGPHLPLFPGGSVKYFL